MTSGSGPGMQNASDKISYELWIAGTLRSIYNCNRAMAECYVLGNEPRSEPNIILHAVADIEKLRAQFGTQIRNTAHMIAGINAIPEWLQNNPDLRLLMTTPTETPRETPPNLVDRLCQVRGYSQYQVAPRVEIYTDIAGPPAAEVSMNLDEVAVVLRSLAESISRQTAVIFENRQLKDALAHHSRPSSESYDARSDVIRAWIGPEILNNIPTLMYIYHQVGICKQLLEQPGFKPGIVVDVARECVRMFDEHRNNTENILRTLAENPVFKRYFQRHPDRQMPTLDTVPPKGRPRGSLLAPLSVISMWVPVVEGKALALKEMINRADFGWFPDDERVLSEIAGCYAQVLPPEINRLLRQPEIAEKIKRYRLQAELTP